MAGHSKWANIKHKKSAKDAKKAKLRSHLIREIMVAVKQGSNDPHTNPRLRLAIQNAKGANIPKANIQRAIAKGSQQDGPNYQTLTYEACAPHGVALYLICATDKPTRTISQIRATLTRHHSTLGKKGSIAHLFAHKGVFQLPKDIPLDEETLMLTLIDAGADHFHTRADHYEVSCPVADFGPLQQTLAQHYIIPTNAQLAYIPYMLLSLPPSHTTQIQRLLEAFEQQDDIQHVHHNLDFNELVA